MLKPIWAMTLCLASLPLAASPLYTQQHTTLFADEQLSQPIGEIEPAVPVELIKTEEKADLVALTFWRKTKGFGRIGHHAFGKNITDLVLTKAFIQQEPHFDVLESKEDPLTGLTWQKVKLQVWLAKAPLTEEIAPLWAKAENTFKTECSVCHKQPNIKQHDSNSWIGLFNGMVGFTNMDKQTGKEVLRYLQLHASDSEEAKH